MNEKTVSGIMSIIEGLDIENMALKAYLKTSLDDPLDDAQIERLIRDARAIPGAQEKVALRWRRLRDQMQSDQALEEALSRFARIVPPPKDTN